MTEPREPTLEVLDKVLEERAGYWRAEQQREGTSDTDRLIAMHRMHECEVVRVEIALLLRKPPFLPRP